MGISVRKYETTGTTTLTTLSQIYRVAQEMSYLWLCT